MKDNLPVIYPREKDQFVLRSERMALANSGWWREALGTFRINPSTPVRFVLALRAISAVAIVVAAMIATVMPLVSMTAMPVVMTPAMRKDHTSR